MYTDAYEIEDDDFPMYLSEGEPGQNGRAAAWQTAIGLQAVDGLTASGYLKETARRHIEGDIAMAEVKSRLASYYESKDMREAADRRHEEADKAAANIAQILGERAFTFSPIGFISLHKAIFSGVFPHAGSLRTCNISKKEWVLHGESVLYTHAEELRATLAYDFEQEKMFDYRPLPPREFVTHFSRFISGIWQIHPFAEGNTRTTAVFAIKYLRSMGLGIGNDMFREHSWYFRNALVRANYRNYRLGVTPTTLFLERFFLNLLFGESYELRNRDLSIDTLLPSSKGHAD